jgi:hypothetical protein
VADRSEPIEKPSPELWSFHADPRLSFGAVYPASVV